MGRLSSTTDFLQPIPAARIGATAFDRALGPAGLSDRTMQRPRRINGSVHVLASVAFSWPMVQATRALADANSTASRRHGDQEGCDQKAGAKFHRGQKYLVNADGLNAWGVTEGREMPA